MKPSSAMTKDELVAKIIEILRMPGEEMTDGECMDEVVLLLEAEGYDVFLPPVFVVGEGWRQ